MVWSKYGPEGSCTQTYSAEVSPEGPTWARAELVGAPFLAKTPTLRAFGDTLVQNPGPKEAQEHLQQQLFCTGAVFRAHDHQLFCTGAVFGACQAGGQYEFTPGKTANKLVPAS
jgi:hypothetical protein